MCPVPEGYCVVQASPLQSSYTSHSSQCPTAEACRAQAVQTLAQGFLQKLKGFIQSTVPDSSQGEDEATSFSLQVPCGLLLYWLLLFVFKGWKTNSSSSGLEEEDRHGDSKGKIFSWAWALRKHSAMIPFHQSRLTFSADLYLSKFGIQLGKRCRWSFSHGWGF